MAKEKQITEPVNYYDGLIVAYERKFQPWESRADKILTRYRDEGRSKQDSDTKFNILWSNVNTLVPATFSKLPQPDVARRFRDQDPVGRVASLILERALGFEIEHYPDYRATMKEGVLDRFLPGRGTAWARYEPHFKAQAAQLPEDGLQVSEDQDEPDEQIDYECAPTDYVNWKDFGHNVARTWEEVFVVWRIVYMHEEGVEERFGKKIASTLSYDATPEDKKKELAQQETKKQARIYEIWDKQKKRVFWMSRSKKQMLDERDDPLGLQDFFPCPRPLYATMTNDSLVPVPDFALYQDQARELDTIADRIDGLVKMLQVKGCYDASTPELARLFTEGVNGTLIPVKNFAAFAERKGLQGSMDLVDLKPIYEAIKVCFESAREIINFIYQITGISDIVRGQTEASETLGAQQLKVNFVGLRLGDMKRDVARFATDLLQLKAQIMCHHYSPQTIMAMAAVEQLAPADQQLIPQAMALLLGQERMTNPDALSPNPLRAFRIEVNADSLIELDDRAEKEDAKEFLGGLSKFLETAGQIGMVAPQMIPMMVEIIKWATTKFKVGKNLEGTLDQAIEQLKVAAQQPPPPNPEVMKVQEDAKVEAQKIQSADQQQQREMGMKDQQHQREMQMKDVQHQREMKLKETQGIRDTDADMKKHEMTTSAKKSIESEKAAASSKPVVQIDAQKAMESVANDLVQMAKQNQQAHQQQTQALIQVMEQMKQAVEMMAKVMMSPREHTVSARDQSGKISKSISRLM